MGDNILKWNASVQRSVHVRNNNITARLKRVPGRIVMPWYYSGQSGARESTPLPMEMLYRCKMVKCTRVHSQSKNLYAPIPINISNNNNDEKKRQSIITPFLQCRKHAIIITLV